MNPRSGVSQWYRRPVRRKLAMAAVLSLWLLSAGVLADDQVGDLLAAESASRANWEQMNLAARGPSDFSNATIGSGPSLKCIDVLVIGFVVSILACSLACHLRTQKAVGRVREEFKLLLEERNSIAGAQRAEQHRAVHRTQDSLLQGTQALALKFEGIARQLPPQHPLRDAMDAWLMSANQLVDDARDNIQQLSCYPYRDELLRILTLTLADFGASGLPTIVATQEGQSRALREEAWLEAYSLAREAIATARWHSAASSISVTIRYRKDALAIDVTDNGSGFKTGQTSSARSSQEQGLSDIRSRADHVGASIGIKSSIGRGTTVSLSIPADIAYETP